MEYKIFGSGRSSNSELTAQLQAFCELDDVQREALAAWFESTSDFNVYSPELPPNILASTLLPEQFRKTAEAIRFLLNAWHQYSLQIVDIERDLLLLGLSPEQIRLVSDFLQRLSPVKERVWLDGLEGNAHVTGLPTLDDANIVWEARALFGGQPFYYYAADANEATYKRCFGLACLAVVELMVSDLGGNSQRMAIQMSENVFKSFLRAFNRADEQLTSLKDFINPLNITNMKH